MSEWVLQTRKRLSRFFLVRVTGCIRFISRIVPYRIGICAGGAFGFVSYYLLRRERTRAVTHLTMVFKENGPSWVRRTARRSFINLGRSLLEVMMMTSRRLGRVVEVRGEEHLRNALARGKGVVFVTGHIGNWELMAHVVAARCPLSVIAAPIEPEQVNDLIVNLRAGMGVRTVLRNRPGAVRELIRVFRENRALGILIDQDTDVESAFVDFMGKPAWTPTAAASMAIKFGAPLLFGYDLRGRGNRHTVTIEEPLDLVRTGDAEQDAIANTTMLTRKIETVIRKNPEQWVWMHRRWRRQP
jgi:KDO2-lipid IV(A) lauroyltransferase